MGADRLRRAVLDPAPYDDNYLSLKPEGQTRTVAGLEDLAVTTASAILDMARDDQWEDIRTEDSDPFARLTSYTDLDRGGRSTTRFPRLVCSMLRGVVRS